MNTLSFFNEENSKFALSYNTSPLSQFEIRDLLSIDAPMIGNLHLSITNIGFYLITGAIILLILFLFNK